MAHLVGSPLVRRLGSLANLTARELACVSELEEGPVRFERGKEIFDEGQDVDNTYILHAGWGCSFKLLPSGERQIIAIALPGDCVNMRSTLNRSSSFSFLAITDVIASRVRSARMVQVLNEFPYLGVALLLATAQDDEMITEHLVSIGRRTAIERLAHHFLELHDRLSIAGLANGTKFHCPLTQFHLGDTLGLSAIHVNRMLRELREKKLMAFSDYTVDLLDFAGLQVLASYIDRRRSPVVVRSNTADLRQ